MSRCFCDCEHCKDCEVKRPGAPRKAANAQLYEAQHIVGYLKDVVLPEAVKKKIADHLKRLEML